MDSGINIIHHRHKGFGGTIHILYLMQIRIYTFVKQRKQKTKHLFVVEMRKCISNQIG